MHFCLCSYSIVLSIAQAVYGEVQQWCVSHEAAGAWGKCPRSIKRQTVFSTSEAVCFHQLGVGKKSSILYWHGIHKTHSGLGSAAAQLMSIVKNVLFLSVLKLVFLTVFLRIFLPFLLEAKKHNILVLKFGMRNFEVSRSHFRRQRE